MATTQTDKTFAQALAVATSAATPTTIYTATTGDILKFIRVSNVSTTQTLTSKTLTAPKITSDSSINDAGGNALIKFPSTVPSFTSPERP